MADAFVEQIGRGACRSDEVGSVDARVTDPVIRAHIDIAHARLEIGSGISRIGLCRDIVVDDRIDHRAPLRVDPRAAGQGARLDGEDTRHDRGVTASDPGDGVRIRGIGLMREIALIADRQAATVVAARDRGVDTRGELRIGDHVAAGRDLPARDRIGLDIGIDAQPSAAARRRPLCLAARSFGIGTLVALRLEGRALDQNERHSGAGQAGRNVRLSHGSTPHIRNRCRSGARWG